MPRPIRQTRGTDDVNSELASGARAVPEPTPSPTNALRYFAWLYSPPATQRLLQILLEVELEVRGVLRPGVEHRVAHLRLEWWRAEAERLVAGNAVHPLTRALMASGNPMPPPTRASIDSVANTPNTAGPAIGGLVDTAVWDLAAATFGTREEVTGYCTRWAAAMLEPIAPDDRELAQSLGAAIREIELLCDLANDARLGRLRVPLDELERESIDPEALAKPPWPAKLCDLLVARHRALRAAITAGVASVARDKQAAMRGLLVWAALATRRSQRAEQALPNEMQPPRHSLLTEGWLAWRIARRAMNGSLR